jgi:hypothetical protein
MVDSLFNNCPIKVSAFRWFYDENNFHTNLKTTFGNYQLRNQFKLTNGKISIQGGTGKYCKELNGFTTHFELGFPSFPIEELKQYADDETDLTGTIYSYVPFYFLMYIIMKYKEDI